MPKIICHKCGRETLYEGEAPKFCAHCASELKRPDAYSQIDECLNEVRALDDTAERYAHLIKARERFPDNFLIEREILYLGRLHERGGRPDFYRIPYWPLTALENPREYSAKDRKRMLDSFFQNPEIARVGSLSGDADAFWDEYLLHMAREYVNMFLKGSSANSTLLGFRRRESEVMRRSAACLARMLTNIGQSDLVDPALKPRLASALKRAFVIEFPELPAQACLANMTGEATDQ